MAKRRRRIKIKNTSLLAALTTLLSLLLFATSAANSHQHHHNHNNYHHPTSQQDYKLLASQAAQQQQQQTILGNNSPTSAGASTLHLCAQLPLHTARQLKLCKLVGHSASVDEALAAGASKGLAECRSQFKNERWNCTHSLAGGGDHNLLTSELAQSVGNRESGFLNAITAAGIVHAIATACSVGSLRDCACDKTRVGLIRRHEDSRIGWGGCSNNIRHGMVYAKHLVELLDAYHQHERLQHEQPDEQATTTHRGKRALSRADTEPMQLRGRHHHHQRPHLHHPHHHSHQSRQALVHDPPQAASGTSQVEQQQQLAFCQRNHNISQAAHFKLIKSLLSKNSLERHQEFRLAMNMHNNKIGRMAVAKNMELRCRCHGLSGSCSLKTCWQTLPDFQLIGAYLRKKYDASVHLPTAIDVNKLIPMMDRAEISAILNGGAAADQSPAPTRLLTGSLAPTSDSYTTVSETVSSGGHLLASSSSASGKPDEPAPEFAPLVAAGPPAGRIQLSGHFIMTPTTSTTPSPAAKQQQLVDLSAYSPLNAPANPLYASYFESIRRQQQTSTTATTPQQVTASVPEATLATTVATTTTTTTSAMSDLSLQEIPATNIAPMTQQQYQALIRDMKLCNNSSTLLAREIQPEQQQHQGGGSKRIGGGTSKKTQTAFSAYQYQQQQQATTSGQQMKNANQQLSHLLHSNKDELIHLHKSPDYCEADVRHGFAGIQSRQCSENPLAPDNCDKLCCGRGYTKHTYQQEYQCDCKFQYCCEILCSICKREIKVVLCK